MKTWEVYKMALENPKIIVVRSSDSRKFKFDEYGRFEPVNKAMSYKCSSPSDEWELIREQVDFMTAIMALEGGKTIKCEWIGKDGESIRRSTYFPKKEFSISSRPITDVGGSAPCVAEVLRGKWYIED